MKCRKCGFDDGTNVVDANADRSLLVLECIHCKDRMEWYEVEKTFKTGKLPTMEDKPADKPWWRCWR